MGQPNPIRRYRYGEVVSTLSRALRNMKATMDRPARLRLTPRLVLIFAVLACVFGWGHTVAEAASSADPSAAQAAMTAPHTASPANGDVGLAATDQDQGEHAATGHGPAGHDGAGHGTSHEHSVSCMASSATAAFGLVAAPDIAALVISVVPPPSRVRDSAAPLVEQRAPSIATLCVQRT